MGTSTSSRAAVASNKIDSGVSLQQGAGGRKAVEGELISQLVEESFSFVDKAEVEEIESETETESESDSEEESEDEDEYDEDVAQILSDALALKTLATHYLHPEIPVASTIGVRCYFHRASAPEVESVLEADERARILADAAALKQYAVAYSHPEQSVVTDATAFARNYFKRASGPVEEDLEVVEERARVLADAAALKSVAVDYAHPEVGVTVSDPTVFGRSYFDGEAESKEDMDERVRVLEEASALKKLAVDYSHPENSVETSDATIFGRNYFTRNVAPEEEDADERARILAEMAAMKQLAVDYMHPEKGVNTCDATAYGRNYFTRPSAPADDGDSEERAKVLADARALKAIAVGYLHPEVGVKTTDATACARDYFDRYTAPDAQGEDEERAKVLAEAKALKDIAVGYLHPEIGIRNTDATAFARNYFTRASAPEQDENPEERALVLAEAAAMKKFAVDYMHPEVGVETTDATVCARNYFTRASVPEQEDEDAEERALILAEAAAMKKLAVDYMHPEVGVETTNATVCARNYFTRASAPEQEDGCDAEERALVLAEAAAMKKLAVDYMHPEVAVETSDATLCARNYFTRASAPEQEDECDAEERALILAEAAAMKKLASDYMHPEVAVETSDATLCARNYFTRASASEQEDECDAEERALVLAEAAAMKKLAVDYMHPEVGVVTSDATACARNYYDRFSVMDSAAISTVSTAQGSVPVVTARERNVSNASDMSEFDDVVFNDMRQTFDELRIALPSASKHVVSKTAVEETEEEGDMSRSPSSVMLFGMDAGAY